MKIVYAPDALAHAPRAEMKHGTMIAAREVPRRAEIVRDALAAQSGFEFITPPPGLPDAAHRVHDGDYLAFLETAWARWEAHVGAAGPAPDAFPLIFPVASLEAVRPSAIDGQISYYALDTGTPLTEGAWRAAVASAACSAEAARLISAGEHAVFALTRPPGHHAAAAKFGGYCFLNNAAIAAQTLREAGAARVAILDLDYHHGNGTQSIFYARGDVLVVNIHADPDFEFPFFLGRADEGGIGEGEGANLNLPLPRGTDAARYGEALESACAAISEFRAEALVVSWGFDTFREDPLSTFQLDRDDFARIGARLAGLGLPAVLMLEGGYATQALGANVAAGLSGFSG